MSDVIPLYGFGSGGAALNLSVVGNPKPSSPKANTIWLDTDAHISNWIFSPAQPISAHEGMAWIVAGTLGNISFNALKQNGIIVYPASAKQYVGGVWKSVVAQIYQNGEWIDWDVFYYNAGNMFQDITGGYFSNVVNTSYGTGTVELLSDKISLRCKGAAQAVVRTQNALDISAISVLQVRVHVNVISDYSSNKGNLHFYATEKPIKELGQVSSTDLTEVKSYDPGINEDFYVDLDVSTIAGSKYIFVALQTAQRAVEAYCDILEIKGKNAG